jgi:two-component system, OmpR family, sensor histidine kinase BaeS
MHQPATLATLGESPAVTAVLVAIFTGLAAVTALIARRILRNVTSLRVVVLTLMASTLAFTLVGAFLCSQLMLVDAIDIREMAKIIAIAAVLSSVFGILVAKPLIDDVTAVERAVRQLDAGERSITTGVQRRDELGRVALALEDTARRLTDLERQQANDEHERRQWIANIGHDLRTPLTSMQAGVEGLLDGMITDQPRMLRAMRTDVEALSALIDDLFLVSRLDVGRLDLAMDPIDLAELADSVVEAHSASAAAQSVHLELSVSGHCPVVASGTGLARVFRNLLDNAVRFTPPGGRVEIRVMSNDQHNVIDVAVSDSGPGFDPEVRERAFERFVKADAARERSSGGSGLGLAIARGIVEAHGGTIWLGPGPHGDVRFRIPAA